MTSQLSSKVKNRIDTMFEKCREENRAALILFLTCGFPNEDITRRVLPILAENGCDLVELGVPFSDPIADGPTIQHASSVALEAGMTFDKTLAVARDFRSSFATPLILFGALNPFLRRGLKQSAQDAFAAGADGFLAADLPVEENNAFREACTENNLHLIPLIAPTSTDGRIKSIAEHSTGFLYCMSLKGTTGARSAVGGDVAPYLDRVRNHSQLPIALGFGISKPEHVREVVPHCDGVVVGSALVNLVKQCVNENLDMEKVVGEYVRSLVSELKK